jgi:hypothetical protein
MYKINYMNYENIITEILKSDEFQNLSIDMNFDINFSLPQDTNKNNIPIKKLSKIFMIYGEFIKNIQNITQSMYVLSVLKNKYNINFYTNTYNINNNYNLDYSVISKIESAFINIKNNNSLLSLHRLDTYIDDTVISLIKTKKLLENFKKSYFELKEKYKNCEINLIISKYDLENTFQTDLFLNENDIENIHNNKKYYKYLFIDILNNMRTIETYKGKIQYWCNDSAFVIKQEQTYIIEDKITHTNDYNKDHKTNSKKHNIQELFEKINNNNNNNKNHYHIVYNYEIENFHHPLYSDLCYGDSANVLCFDNVILDELFSEELFFNF